MKNLQTLTVHKKSQLKVKNKLTLQSLLVILRCLKDDYTQQHIASLVGVSKQAISKLMKRLINHEYIRLDDRTSCNIYKILPRGQLILSGGSKIFEVGIGRLHNVRYKYPIVVGEISQEGLKRVEMVNWTKVVGDVFGCKVECSGRSIIVSPGIFFGYKLSDLLPQARDVADSIAERLKVWYGLELGSPQSVGKLEWAIVTPLPSLSLSGVSLRTVDSWLDASRGLAEVEFTDMDRAQKFIDMPKKLEWIETSLDEHRRLTEVNYESITNQSQNNQKSTTPISKQELSCSFHNDDVNIQRKGEDDHSSYIISRNDATDSFPKVPHHGKEVE